MKPYRLFIQKKYSIASIKNWCDSQQLTYTKITTDKTIAISSPRLFPEDHSVPAFKTQQAGLPDVYVANLKNVVVIEGSDIVITNNNTALYDEMAYDTEGRYGSKINKSKLIVSREIKSNQLGLRYKITQKKLPKIAIHFCKDYSFNYFHWLLEALPRLWVVDQYPEYDAVPLVVDQLLPQQLASLSLLNKKNRDIISLKLGEACQIENLIYPSGLSYAHDNYHSPITHENDFVISPQAIRYLRDNYAGLMKTPRPNKKLFISRTHLGNKRRLVNDEEVGQFLAKRGFEIIHPEHLNFDQQVAIFSEASVIIGASGAALANIVFAPQNCQVFVLSANNQRVNIALFTTIASVIHLNLCYIFGQDKIIDPYSQAHNSFFMEMELLEGALKRC